ncbi:MAG: EscU/YscU/HrcU family type III secretion system export apparatus switch protein, partial [Bdellovibrionales bacterium]|nr:EscU/YscU/HrcU family type III secretion system export apparatus switch protein [Bdellovibrionales bacterium]
AMTAEMLQVGVHFSAAALLPSAGRLDFFKGIRRLLGLQPGEGPGLLRELGKRVLYLATFIGASVWLTLSYGRELLVWGLDGAEQALELLCAAATAMLRGAAFAVLCFGGLDLLLARKRRFARLRMDVNEFRQEMRESMGDPELRGLRRQRHQETVLGALAQGVRRSRLLVLGRKTGR